MNSQPIISRQSRGSNLIWLAYLGFLLLDPILEPHRHIWLPTLGVMAAFVGVYSVYVRTRQERVRRAMIAVTWILALITMPWNTGAITFFVYAAAFLPFSFESTPLVLSLFSVECLSAVAEAYLLPHRGNWYTALMACFLLLAIGGGNIFLAQKMRADCKLRLKQEEIEALAALAERERIARDLHDVLGHTLSLIVLKAELAGRLLDADTDAGRIRARSELSDVETTARSALAEVREAIGGYRARGLGAEIDAARGTLAAAGVVLHAEAPPAPDLKASEETVLALAVREAVTNIVRHAGAHTCSIRFVSKDGRHTLLVEDDGRHAAQREGNGLRGMRERVESLGGRLQLTREQGTRLVVELPAQQAQLAGARVPARGAVPVPAHAPAPAEVAVS